MDIKGHVNTLTGREKQHETLHVGKKKEENFGKTEHRMSLVDDQ